MPQRRDTDIPFHYSKLRYKKGKLVIYLTYLKLKFHTCPGLYLFGRNKSILCMSLPQAVSCRSHSFIPHNYVTQWGVHEYNVLKYHTSVMSLWHCINWVNVTAYTLSMSCMFIIGNFAMHYLRVISAFPLLTFYKTKDYQHRNVSLLHQLDNFAQPLCIGCQKESQSVMLKWLMRFPALITQ